MGPSLHLQLLALPGLLLPLRLLPVHAMKVLLPPELVKIRQAKFERWLRKEKASQARLDHKPFLLLMGRSEFPWLPIMPCFFLFQTDQLCPVFWLPCFLEKFDPVKVDLLASLCSAGVMPGGITPDTPATGLVGTVPMPLQSSWDF